MLLADKHNLQQELKLNLLHIEEKELNYYTQNCYTVGTQAALLAGFAFAGLVEVDDTLTDETRLSAHLAMQMGWSVSCVVALCLEIMALVKAMQLSIMGPGLALRGPDGSMHNAVQGMTTHYRFTLTCFSLGLICFMLSALLYSWMQFDWTLALPCTLLIVYFLFILQRHWWRIYKRFRLPSDSAVTGAFNIGGQLAATGVPEAPTAEEAAQNEQYEREMDQLRQQYAHYPESVRNAMGIGSTNVGVMGAPPGMGGDGAGPSSAGQAGPSGGMFR